MVLVGWGLRPPRPLGPEEVSAGAVPDREPEGSRGAEGAVGVLVAADVFPEEGETGTESSTVAASAAGGAAAPEAEASGGATFLPSSFPTIIPAGAEEVSAFGAVAVCGACFCACGVRTAAGCCCWVT